MHVKFLKEQKIFAAQRENDHKTTPCTSDDLKILNYTATLSHLYSFTYVQDYIFKIRNVLYYTISTAQLEKMKSKFLVFPEFE